MLFDFEQPEELMTPSITHRGGVNGVNPILAPSGITSLDEHDMCFSSIPSKKNGYGLLVKDTPDENVEQQEDVFSTFNLPVLSELSRTELQLDILPIDPYLSPESFASASMDDSNFYPVEDDSTSSTPIWVGGECTIESQTSGDMAVPLSPPLSSAASSPASATTKLSSKKRNYSAVERKLRKKDQNKTAAEKYRLKKRSERTELVSRHAELKNQNRELKFEMENLTFQLEQFKQLFVDILQIPIPPTVSK